MTKVQLPPTLEEFSNGQTLDDSSVWLQNLTEKDQKLAQKIIATRMTDKTSVKSIIPAVTIAGGTFARLGDLSVAMGQRKAGKTTIQQYIVATALMEEIPPDLDTLQITSTYCGGRDMVYLDSEGSAQDTFNFIAGVMRIMGVETMPENFYAYHFREFDIEECREGLKLLCQRHTNSHIWIIDGVADLVENPDTDPKEARTLVRSIMRYAGELNAAFIGIIHDNPTKKGQQTKARGHLGTEIERKASAAIEVEKNNEDKRHTIRCRFIRSGEDFAPIAFWFEHGRPVSRMLTETERQQITNSDYHRIQELTTLRKQCFLGQESRTEKTLKAAIELYQSSSPSKDAARNKRNRNLESMLKHNLIRLDTSGKEPLYYVVTPNPSPPAPMLYETDTERGGRDPI